MQLVTLFRFVEVLVDAPGGAILTFLTDLPGEVMAPRLGPVYIAATSGRHPYRLSLSGACKGKLYKLSVAPAGFSAVRIYAAKVYARVLGPSPTPWAWHDIPVLDTPVEWQPIQLPIPQTPIDWQPVKLPIPQTADDWAPLQLPVKPTPVIPDWVQMQVDA